MRKFKFEEKKKLSTHKLSLTKKINIQPTERVLLIRHTETVVMSSFVCGSVYTCARVVNRLLFYLFFAFFTISGFPLVLYRSLRCLFMINLMPFEYLVHNAIGETKIFSAFTCKIKKKIEKKITVMS